MAVSVRKLIADLGGVAAVHVLMSGKVTVKAVEKWHERDAMPLRRFAELSAAAKAADRPFALDDYLTTTRERTKANDHGSKRGRRAA